MGWLGIYDCRRSGLEATYRILRRNSATRTVTAPAGRYLPHEVWCKYHTDMRASAYGSSALIRHLETPSCKRTFPDHVVLLRASNRHRPVTRVSGPDFLTARSQRSGEAMPSYPTESPFSLAFEGVLSLCYTPVSSRTFRAPNTHENLAIGYYLGSTARVLSKWTSPKRSVKDTLHTMTPATVFRIFGIPDRGTDAGKSTLTLVRVRVRCFLGSSMLLNRDGTRMSEAQGSAPKNN